MVNKKFQRLLNLLGWVKSQNGSAIFSLTLIVIMSADWISTWPNQLHIIFVDKRSQKTPISKKNALLKQLLFARCKANFAAALWLITLVDAPYSGDYNKPKSMKIALQEGVHLAQLRLLTNLSVSYHTATGSFLKCKISYLKWN